jgi:hypothetical protein
MAVGAALAAMLFFGPKTIAAKAAPTARILYLPKTKNIRG